ncbi:endonuclease domain-containing protein [Actinomyces howellii]|uniref:DUF559 domain-containing protein n=1 Tax=Actinomyces howellii TaxID=52771 RepID=A0A3S4R4G4_9ACTO|nr:hypothetical protein [Actinomyces howellii]VEG29338.1 Uncharacterised protein [Actinomyces howellii]
MHDDLLDTVRGCYGAVRLRDLGLTRTQRRHVAALIEAGHLAAGEHGVVSLPGTDRALVLARVHGGLLTCGKAMEYHGLPVVDRHDHIHLVVPDSGRFAALDGEVLHVDRRLPRPSPTSEPVEPLADALARYLRCHASPESPIVALDAALHAEIVTPEQIRALLHGYGSARARARLDRASRAARSPLETLARLDLEDAGMGFEDGVDIEGVGEVDLVVGGRIVVELDGYTYHSDEYQFGLDRWRDRQLLARGYLPLRFTRREVYAHQVVAEVRRALDRWKVSRSAAKSVEESLSVE